jgi:hypothetical protein
MTAQQIDFETRAEFSDLVLHALQRSRHTILLIDPTLADWPLDTRVQAQALREAISRGARLRVLLRKTDWLERNAPRLARLRRDFSARVEFRRLPAMLRLVDSVMVCDAVHTIRRVHADLIKGSAFFDEPRQANTPTERFESAWPESEPCLPATTLGL